MGDKSLCSRLRMLSKMLARAKVVAKRSKMVWWWSTAEPQSMSVPSGSENRFCGNHTEQFNSMIMESVKSGWRSEKNLRQYDFHVMEVTKPILSVSYLCENGTETHLARNPFLKYGDRREPPIKKNWVYFVKAQIVHKVKGTIESCVRAGDSQGSRVRAGESQKSCVRVDGWQKQKSCVRAGDSQTSCVQVEDSQNSCVRAEELAESCVRAQNSCAQAEEQQIFNSHISDAIIQPIVEDPSSTRWQNSCRGRSGASLHTMWGFRVWEKETWIGTHSIQTMVHIMRQKQSTIWASQTCRAHRRRQRTSHCSVWLPCCERHCSIRRTESFDHTCEIVCLSCWNERCNRHVRSDIGKKLLNCIGPSDIIM